MSRVSLITLAAASLLSTCATSQSQTSQTNDPAWSHAINLMALIDPAQDAVSGKWTMTDGALVCEAGRFARIEIPFEPPEEYYFRIIFCRRDGSETVAQYFSVNGRPQMWNMGCDHSSTFGLDLVGGRPATKNATTYRPPAPLKNAQVYCSLLQVRKSSVRAYLDGKLFSHWKTNYTDGNVSSPWLLRNAGYLGVGAYQAKTMFQKIELIEVTGKGRVMRRPANTKTGTPR